MSRTLGQQIVIENRGGAGGSIATRQIAKARPTAIRSCLGGTGTLAINPTLYAQCRLRSAQGFRAGRPHRHQRTRRAGASVACPPAPSAELIALARKEPGKLNYASAGAGSGIHLATEYFASLAGIKLTHVPYKGSGPALTDLVGGHVAIYFSSLPPAIGLREGRQGSRAGGDRLQSARTIFPDLPTVAEAALPGYEAVLHYGIVAPAGTPRPIVEKLSTPRCARH